MLKWEEIETKMPDDHAFAYRAAVPGGWLVMVSVCPGEGGVTMTFYPDASHAWDGSSVYTRSVATD